MQASGNASTPAMHVMGPHRSPLGSASRTTFFCAAFRAIDRAICNRTHGGLSVVNQHHLTRPMRDARAASCSTPGNRPTADRILQGPRSLSTTRVACPHRRGRHLCIPTSAWRRDGLRRRIRGSLATRAGPPWRRSGSRADINVGQRVVLPFASCGHCSGLHYITADLATANARQISTCSATACDTTRSAVTAGPSPAAFFRAVQLARMPHCPPTK